MAGDVEALVVEPPGPAKPPGPGRGETLAEPRQAGEASVEVCPHALEARRALPGRRLEQHHCSDVHVRALIGLLELEEGRVECVEIVGGHASS